MIIGEKITVCLTTKANDLFFKRAVNSIKSQTLTPLEVIVVINGYSDGPPNENLTATFLRKDLKKVVPEDWMIVWTESEDKSMSNAKNLAMHYARGEWLLILDGNDFLLPSCIEFYSKHLLETKAELITEYQYAMLTHFNFNVTKTIPSDKASWIEHSRQLMKNVCTSSWKRGELPLNILFIKNEGKKYYPLDYDCMGDKVLILQYLLEERRILLSDYFSYIINIHPGSDNISAKWMTSANSSESRFKKMASNILVNSWTLKEKIFEKLISNSYPTDLDIEYIEKTISYLSLK